MSAKTPLIYGAYGFTGELIARHALEKGLRPILAGRRRAPLASLASELDLPFRVLDLDDRQVLRDALDDVEAVLHCAGPFRYTSRSMLDSCLRSGTHYLDITGECEVFESIFALHPAAQLANVVLLPGVGMDVVPSDCLAAHLAGQLPDATHLDLAFSSSGGGVSRGTLRTVITGLGEGGLERVGGALVPRPGALRVHEIDFPGGRRQAMMIPWGDLSTAYRTTGIPNIKVYFGVSPRRIRTLRRLQPFMPLLASRISRYLLLRLITLRAPGPSQRQREVGHTSFFGLVSNPAGATRNATLQTPEGYSLTALTAVECLRRVLKGELGPGAWTPALAFGTDFIKSFPGVFASW